MIILWLKPANSTISAALLNSLVAVATWDPERVCLPSTRTAVLDDIVRWVHETPEEGQPNKPFFLVGVAGSGKSAVAHTLAELFHDIGSLGGSFFFDHANADRNNPSKVFSSIARQLAASDAAIAQEIVEALKKDPSLPNATPRRQFESLFRDPCASTSSGDPLVLIFDALDECESRSGLLDAIATEFPNLPPRFRVIVTGRLERDISMALTRNDNVREYTLPCNGTAVLEDISALVTLRMGKVASAHRYEPTWPGAQALQELVALSSGLFIWAKTACDFISKPTAPSPKRQLAAVLSGGAKLADIDELYSLALRDALDWEDLGTRTAFQLFVGAVVVARTPLSARAIQVLVGQRADPDSEQAEVDVDISAWELLCLLQSILDGAASPDSPIRTMHASFRDFLTTETRAKGFYIDVGIHNANISRGCVKLMNTRLKRNICGLANDAVLNNEIPAETVIEAIGEELRYAICYGLDHLIDVSYVHADSAFMDTVGEFARKKMLNWLEALSVLGRLDAANRPRQLSQWIEGLVQRDDILCQIVKDMARFIATFREIITAAPLQIYSSALLFTPSDTLLRRTYFEISDVGSAILNGEKSWSPLLAVLAGHTGQLTSAIYSPDGGRLASCAMDSTIRLWDGSTGAPLAAPLAGHTATVTSIAFSPDGEILASASEDHTIRLWNVKTGKAIGDALTGHKDVVRHVAFSPDGSRIASASRDSTARLWDGRTGAPIAGELVGHGDVVTSVAFSPDGEILATASTDCTVRLWKGRTGVPIDGVLLGHKDKITSISYSPDGRQLASSSNDRTIRLWDGHTGAFTGKILEGHTNDITFFTYSPDGNRIASVSWDATVRLWDPHTGTLIGGPLIGHGGTIYHAAFSPDSERLATAGSDCAVRLWDGRSGAAIGGPMTGHTYTVISVAFSPDGDYIASASNDNTVRIWDGRTGGTANATAGIRVDIDISRDGNRILHSLDKVAHLWDANTGAVIAGPLVHTRMINRIGFSPDGNIVAIAHYEICLWNGYTGESIGAPLAGHTHFIFALAFSPDSSRLASGSRDRTIRLWDTKTGASIGILNGHSDFVMALTFSPDGSTLASASYDGTARIWDPSHEAQIGDSLALGALARTLRLLIFSPNGTYLACLCTENFATVWDMRTRTSLVEYAGSRSPDIPAGKTL
ncbi:hypothetical protein BOTBODRAFT_115211 [Botryobasidium botryosum FD-172 SS1]|uniref:Nephrocystin 3-like N-terminal domain-containing protein n=1 Tax=Botryobasidium botryosum (strain FD-172 SS1) TaxID=930990 RepID=A0A067M539_BOTB1|nr:hypothetical protein BOTBODRAFT_115211 [Botryobasidium botryosum FD-172 SS1]